MRICVQRDWNKTPPVLQSNLEEQVWVEEQETRLPLVLGQVKKLQHESVCSLASVVLFPLFLWTNIFLFVLTVEWI